MCPSCAGRIASVQALSGTGALRVATEFIKTHIAKGGDKDVARCNSALVTAEEWEGAMAGLRFA
eukprot:7458512-Pyramimonas_sp.AAC.1